MYKNCFLRIFFCTKLLVLMEKGFISNLISALLTLMYVLYFLFLCSHPGTLPTYCSPSLYTSTNILP